VFIDQEIGKGGAVRHAEQLGAGGPLHEHGGRRYTGSPIGGRLGCDARSNTFGSTVGRTDELM
jgi:hypothetical protein